jgi:hypothetical protein
LGANSRQSIPFRQHPGARAVRDWRGHLRRAGLQPAAELTFKGGPPSPNHSERALEHKVQLAKKQSAMNAPAINKRILTTGIAKVTPPDMPAMPKLNEAAPMEMAGVTGAGIGMPSATSGTEGSSGGAARFHFSACAKAAAAPSPARSTI